MTSCVIKVCRNYKGRSKAPDNVTYHRIPSDIVTRSQWVSIIRKSRGEELWQPTKYTQLCSEHFDEKDLYYANNQGRRRLKKGALPKKAIFLSSMQPDTSDEDEDLILQHDNGNEKSMNITASNINSAMPVDIQPSTSSAKSYGFDVECSSPSASTKQMDNKCTGADNITTNEDFSDLESIFDTPRKAKLKKELRRKTVLQKKHILKIQSLRRKNARLRKKIANFKNVLETLKKDRHIDNDTYNVLKMCLLSTYTQS